MPRQQTVARSSILVIILSMLVAGCATSEVGMTDREAEALPTPCEGYGYCPDELVDLGTARGCPSPARPSRGPAVRIRTAAAHFGRRFAPRWSQRIPPSPVTMRLSGRRTALGHMPRICAIGGGNR